MTKRHFEAIAEIFATLAGSTQVDEPDWEEGWDAAHSTLAMELAAYFQTINPNFNREKFLAACQVS